MKLRHALAFTIFPVVVVLAILQGGALLTRSYMDEASLQAGSALRLAVAALAGHLSRYEPLPALIADHADIEGLLQAPESASLRRVANKYLKEINDLLKSSDIYVMTPDGNTVAASNYDQPGTFIGENFSYRPYFQDAIAGHPARFYALGTTSLKRGYYFSSPVIVARKILGVIVFKVDIESIEASWRGGEYKIFVADPEGIVFMSGSPEWLYTGILPLDAPRLARTQASGQIRCQVHVGADHELQRYLPALELRGQLGDGAAYAVAVVVVEPRIDVRRAGDHVHAVGHGRARHRQAGGQVGGAVVDAGQQMAVQVDHQRRLSGRRWPGSG